MGTVKDIPRAIQPYVLFRIQGGSSMYTFDDQISCVSGGYGQGCLFTSRTGFVAASGDMVAGNFRIRLKMGEGYQDWPVFEVTVDHYTTATEGGVTYRYTEPIAFDFPCSVTTAGRAATSASPAVQGCTANFVLKVFIANHAMPLGGSHAAIALKGDSGSVPASTTAGRRAAATYATYERITDGQSRGQASVTDERSFEGYPGHSYTGYGSALSRPGIFTGLSEAQLAGTQHSVRIPYSTFIAERPCLPGALVAVDPGRAAAADGSSGGMARVHSQDHPEISGWYMDTGGFPTLFSQSGGSPALFRLAQSGGSWGLYTTAWDQQGPVPEGIDGWTALAMNTTAPACQSRPPHTGWNYGDMTVSGRPDRLAAPMSLQTSKAPAPSYSYAGSHEGRPFYEANPPLPGERPAGHASVPFPGESQAFWRYLCRDADGRGHTLCDAIPPGADSCPADARTFPCALPAAPPSLELSGQEPLRDIVLKAGGIALNINRRPSDFRQFAVIGKAHECLMDASGDPTGRHAMVAGGVWGYYPAARQLRAPSGTSGDPSHSIRLRLRSERILDSECSVSFTEHVHYCDLDHEHEQSYTNVSVSGDFVPSTSSSGSLFGGYCSPFWRMVSDANLGAHSLWDDGDSASGSLVSPGDYTMSGLSESLRLTTLFQWDGPANCVTRNSDTIDTLAGVQVTPVGFTLTRTCNANLTVDHRRVDPVSGAGSTVRLPYTVRLSCATSGGGLWDGPEHHPYMQGPNRAGGVAAVQLVSGYSDVSPHAADSSSEHAEPFCGDLHRVFATGWAYALHHGAVPFSGTASFRRENMEGGWSDVERSISRSYMHQGATALACDEPRPAPKDLSSLPVTAKTARTASDLFVRMCSKEYSGGGTGYGSSFSDRRLSFGRVEVSRTADLKSSVMGSASRGGMCGPAVTSVTLVELRDGMLTTLRQEKFLDPDGSKFEELVEDYGDYAPANWSTAVFPDPPVANWVDPNLPYPPSAIDLTYVSKRTGVVSYIRRDRAETVLESGWADPPPEE